MTTPQKKLSKKECRKIFAIALATIESIQTPAQFDNTVIHDAPMERFLLKLRLPIGTLTFIAPINFGLTAIFEDLEGHSWPIHYPGWLGQLLGNAEASAHRKAWDHYFILIRAIDKVRRKVNGVPDSEPSLPAKNQITSQAKRKTDDASLSDVAHLENLLLTIPSLDELQPKTLTKTKQNAKSIEEGRSEAGNIESSGSDDSDSTSSSSSSSCD